MTPSTPSQRLLQVQALSGATFALFLAVHLANQAVATLGASRYDGLQHAARQAYQTPAVELLLVLLPLVVHVVAAVVRLVKFRVPASTGPWRVRLFRYAGRFLLLVIVGHVLATRGPAWSGVVPEGLSFSGLAFTFQFLPAVFWPYYLVLGLAGVVHLVQGVSTAVRVVGGPSQSDTTFWVTVAVAGALVALGVFALGGALFDVGQPETSAYARWVRSW
jgi:hypothetical protein